MLAQAGGAFLLEPRAWVNDRIATVTRKRSGSLPGTSRTPPRPACVILLCYQSSENRYASSAKPSTTTDRFIAMPDQVQ